MDTRKQEMKKTSNTLKGVALEKRVKGDTKPELKKVHTSDDYCSTCGAKTRRTEHYESRHHHHDEVIGGLHLD